MNLHNIVRGCINQVNRDQDIIIKKFISSGLDDFGIEHNIYEEIVVKAQIQPIASQKLQHMAYFNTSNTYRRLYLNGEQNGLSTPLNTNGDLILFNNQVWLIIEAPQQWTYAGWNELTLCLQNDIVEVENGTTSL